MKDTPVEYISVPVFLSPEQWEDLKFMDCLNFDFRHLSIFGEAEPFTDEEQRTGYRIRVHDDHEHKVAVLWRAEQERKAADEKREAEMAACPYVACECGHHEDT